jgi:hypothetical protein
MPSNLIDSMRKHVQSLVYRKGSTVQSYMLVNCSNECSADTIQVNHAVYRIPFLHSEYSICFQVTFFASSLRQISQAVFLPFSPLQAQSAAQHWGMKWSAQSPTLVWKLPDPPSAELPPPRFRVQKIVGFQLASQGPVHFSRCWKLFLALVLDI